MFCKNVSLICGTFFKLVFEYVIDIIFYLFTMIVGFIYKLVLINMLVLIVY